MQVFHLVPAVLIFLLALLSAPGQAAEDVTDLQRREIMGGAEEAGFDRQVRRFFEFVILPAGIVLALVSLLSRKSAG